jgi:competence protein ComEC
LILAALLGAVAGVALQLQQAVLWPLWACQALLALGGLLLPAARRCPGGAWRAAVAALAAAALLGGLTGWRALERQAQALPEAQEGQDLTLLGHVAGLPRAGERGVQFEFELEAANWRGRPVRLPPVVQLGWWSRAAAPAEKADQGADIAPPRVRAGQRWLLEARLHRPHGLANPDGFDLELWFWEQGLQATGSVQTGRGHEPPRLLPGQAWVPVAAARQAVRDAILAAVPDARAAGVLAALVVGDQAAIDSVDWDVFRLTGVAHLISISGLHVTMFAWLAGVLVGRGWRLLARLWPGLLYRLPAPTVAPVGGLALAVAYAVFAGWGVPAQRTVVMLSVLTLLRLAGLRWPWPLVWLLAMVAVLLLDPWALLQPGFWLSFVAVGVLFASSWLGPAPARPGGRLAWLKELLRTQAIVTVALAPLTLLCFGQLSLVGLLANLVAIPWVTGVVTPLAFLGLAWAPLWRLAAAAVQLMTLGLQWLAALPWAVLERPALPGLLMALALAGAVLLVLRLPWTLRAWGLLLAWPLLVWAPLRPPAGEFELLAPDVGQGSAVIVRTAHHTLLHDTGPALGQASAAQRVLLPLLRAAGERPELLIVSHSDQDHSAGLPELARRYPRLELSASYDTRASAGRPATRCEAGQRWVWDGVGFEVLHPRAADYVPGAADNSLSCVLQVTSAGPGGARVALLTADITAREEARLLRELPALHADLLLAPHHGSLTSSSAAWLAALKPRQIVIQSGHLNRYHHPAPEILQRYRELGLPWVASPACGAARWRSQEPQRVDCQREQRRYWQDGRLPQRLSAARGPELPTASLAARRQ